MKHLQHTSKSDETFRTCSQNTIERVQHPDLPLKHPNATLATYLSKKQIKHRG
jgi:hypothetical protein